MGIEPIKPQFNLDNLTINKDDIFTENEKLLRNNDFPTNTNIIPNKNKGNIVKRYVPSLALNKLEQTLISSPPNFEYEKEDFYFLLDLFYKLPAFNKELRRKPNEFIEISSVYFKKSIPTKIYCKYLSYLKSAGIILCDENYDAGKMTGEHYCKGYKLNPELASKIVTVEIPPTATIWKKITQNFNNKNHKKVPDWLKKLKTCMMEIKFDQEGAMMYLYKLL